ncbi:MAG: sodium/glutamate symporter [Saccharofermentanales bacterium]|jgi:ESS family glutamate:Na+ symporter|nr:sodium:glutamate symporter [Clostridiaceae bacterium]
MDFSGSNSSLWFLIVQFGLSAALVLFGNLLRRKIPLLRISLLPTAVIAGFLGLFVRQMGWIPFDKTFLEAVTYHMTAIGFIAISLRKPTRSERETSKKLFRDGVNSGVFIVSNYLIQCAVGLVITIILSLTFMPGIFKAAGIILPLGYGQGPGQAFNIGNTYEQAYGFAGGATFGLAIATMGTLWACIGGIIYLNIVARRRRQATEQVDAARIDHIQEPCFEPGEIPLTEAVDKFTIQLAFVLLIYLVTYGLSSILTTALSGNPGLSKTLVPLIWGFNFLIGSSFALVVRAIMGLLRQRKIMNRQYTNNYLLNRISGSAFDIMVFTSICAIEIGDLTGLWVPFLLMSVAGGFVTLFYIRAIAKVLYPDYVLEGMLAMYGMMTGTISTGIMLLREIDPSFKTPAANNLVVGSSVAIIVGAPMLLLIGLAPQSDLLLYVTLVASLALALILNVYLLRSKLFKRYREN